MATFPSAGRVPDFLSTNGDATKGVEVDYDYHLRRGRGSLYHVYNRIRRLLEYQLIEQEADRLGRPLDLLDIGSGDPSRPGSYHGRIMPLTRIYIGIEPSLTIASRVRPSPSVGVVRANGELSVLRESVVDMSVCFGALDRCLDPSLVLRNMAVALRPGGCALIDLRNRDVWYGSAYERWRRTLARYSVSEKPEQSRRKWERENTPTKLKQRLKAAGFEEPALHSLLYLSSLVRSHSLDWVVKLFGRESCAYALRQVDRIGRFMAPQRGGLFIALARKPN